jgi:hypothetical protein
MTKQQLDDFLSRLETLCKAYKVMPCRCCTGVCLVYQDDDERFKDMIDELRKSAVTED